jgi:peptide/nickel transport system ATP-binding protein
MQLIGQDPIGSLNPRHSVEHLVMEPLRIWEIGSATEQRRRANSMLEEVGLEPNRVRERRPRELSGGECQRVCIARALVMQPRLLVCDEPVASLDVSVQAQILNLLEESKQRFGLSILFVTHDLAVVKRVSDRLAVMYLGKICEIGDSSTIYADAAHPYTKTLLLAIPSIRQTDRRARAVTIVDEPPSPGAPPSGCRFRTRCGLADTQCAAIEPELHPVGAARVVACHHVS